MSEQGFYQGIDGIRIIPAEDIPPGFKHTVGVDLLVNPQNYEYMRPLSARATVIVLGMLREVAPMNLIGEKCIVSSKDSEGDSELHRPTKIPRT